MRCLPLLLFFCSVSLAQDLALQTDAPPSTDEYGELLTRCAPAVPALALYDEGGRAPIRQLSAIWLGDGQAATSCAGLVGASRAELEFEGGLRARVLGVLAVDPVTDVALLAVDATGKLPAPIPVGSRSFTTEQPVGVIGKTITQQRIRALGRVAQASQLAGVGSFALAPGIGQRGLAGAAVLDEHGDLIGMLTSLTTSNQDARIAVSTRALRDLAAGPVQALEEELIEDLSELAPARALLFAGDAEGALLALENTAHPAAKMFRGQALLELGLVTEAIEQLVMACEERPSWLRAPLALGETYLSADQATRALRTFRNARRLSEASPAPRYHAARAYAHLDRNQDTLVHVTQTLKRDPEHLDAIVLRGETRLRQLAFIQAQADFEAALQLDPRSAQARTGLGALAFESRDFERAYECFQAALLLAPNDVSAHQRLARTLIQLDRGPEARELADRAVALAPRSAEARLVLGEVLIDLDQLDEAEQSFEAAVLLQPEHLKAHMGLGSVRLRNGMVQEAQISFHDVLRLDPQHGPALFNSGLCYVMQGDKGKARERYKSLQHIDPRSARVLYERIYGR